MIIQSPGEAAFYISEFPIYWYGIILACSVFVGVFFAECLSRRTVIPPNFFADNSPLVILTGILGARIYYCLLNLPYYLKYPLEIFDIRQGGLSVHGMIFSGIIIIYLISRKYKLKFLTVADVMACVLPLSQAIGRWGNFFNSEAFGIPTCGTWGLYIPLAKRPPEFVNYDLFHPAFLYESILDIILFVILFYLFKRSYKTGTIFFTYFILYSIVRLIVEQIRTDSALFVFGIPVAQAVSILLIIIGFTGLWYINKKSD